MPNPNTPDYMYVKEAGTREFVVSEILKRDLIKLFADYKSSRVGMTSILFRNMALTKQKLEMVDRIIKFIRNYKGEQADLINALKDERIKNAMLSANSAYQKFHYNLLDHREKYQTRTYKDCDGKNHTRREIEIDVRNGESNRKSGLAAVFHVAIEMVQNSTVKNVYSSFVPS